LGRRNSAGCLPFIGWFLFTEFISEAVCNLQLGRNGTLDYLSEDRVFKQMDEDAKDKTIDHVLASLVALTRNKNQSVTHSGSLSEENNRSVGQIYYCSYLTIFCQLYMLLSIQ
jgi:hypothetical protein